MPNEYDILKFTLVSLCFVLVILSKNNTFNWKDFIFLFIAMAATLAADFFLVLVHRYEIGVAIFTIAHISYALRFAGKKAALFFPLSLPLPVIIFLATQDVLISLALLYAGLFITSYAAAIFAIKNKKYPKTNGILIFLGMSLFVICDIFVMIFQLGEMGFTNNPALTNFAADAIWLFYAPSQFCLALSALSLRA